jgi:aminobenzoyl-glutamate utilization protein B
MHDIPLPIPTEEDLAYGRALQATMTLTEEQKALPPFAMQVLDPAPPVAHGGSTDTADVSWNCPTVQMHIANWVIGTPGHSWQSASQCRGSYAKRAMLYAGKAVAGTLIRLLESPTLLEKAKAEHQAKIGDGYVCGLPEGLQPTVPERR